MALFLTLVSGLCWTWVYVEAIRLGFKQKTYAMPLFALGLNFAWEALYSYRGLTRDDTISAQDVVNVCWLVADAVVAFTWLRFGEKDWPERFGKHAFYAWGALVFSVSIVLQVLFEREFGYDDGVKYSAFLQNLLMSVLFIDLLMRRNSTDGQSLIIAVNKWLGTLAPTILFGYLGHRPFVTVVGALCSVFDLIYIGLLVKATATARSRPLTAHAALAARGRRPAVIARD